MHQQVIVNGDHALATTRIEESERKYHHTPWS